MIVTDITEISKTKVKIVIDNDDVFALYKNELRTYKIKKGEELSEKLYQTIIEEVLSKRAKLRCMNLLKNKDYTEYQLRSKLKQGFYPEEIIEQAITYVKSFGYVDDLKYAKAYTEYAGNTKSKKQIEAVLLQKGVSKDVIRQACDQCLEEGELADEEEIIKKLLLKKQYNIQEAGYDEYRKIVGFLYRRGFSLDKIYKVIGQR